MSLRGVRESVRCPSGSQRVGVAAAAARRAGHDHRVGGARRLHQRADGRRRVGERVAARLPTLLRLVHAAVLGGARREGGRHGDRLQLPRPMQRRE